MSSEDTSAGGADDPTVAGGTEDYEAQYGAAGGYEGSFGHAGPGEEYGTMGTTMEEQMAMSGMDPNSAIDRGIARLGTAIGLPPNPAYASHASVMAAPFSSIGLFGPAKAGLEFIGDPSARNLAGAAMSALTPGGKALSETAFDRIGSPSAGSASLFGSSVLSGTPGTWEPSDGRSMQQDGTGESGQTKTLLSPVRKAQVLPVTVPQPSGGMQTNPWAYQRSWWEGNQFNVAPLTRQV